MPAPSADIVKTWCRIGDEFDSLLPMMIKAATRLAGHQTGRGTDYYLAADMPEEVQQWVAANVAYWIENPEAASKESPSPFLDGLLQTERVY